MEFHAMPRPKKLVPDYRYHISGQAVVTFNGTNFYLGEHDSPASHAKYRRLVAEYIATGQTPTGETHNKEKPITVADITAEAREWIAAKFASAPAHHRRYERLCELLDDAYGNIPANDFGPRKLAEMRDGFVSDGCCRKYTNTQVRSVVSIFRYALSRELIESGTLVKLQSLDPLRHGQTHARESTQTIPANIDDVRKTAAYLSPPLKAMVRVQASTGMRPSELVAMRPMDIDRSGAVWIYRPKKHKTSHRGKSKAVPITGDARKALLPFLLRAADEYCFSPIESLAWHHEQRAAKRKTPAHHGNRKGLRVKEDPQRKPGRAYNKDSYRRAIQRAAEVAKVDHWFPYQLRHLAGTAVRDALGVEAAQALLGHSRAAMTEHYARQTEAKAIAASSAAPCVGAV